MSLDVIETGSFAKGESTYQSNDSVHILSWNIARGSRLDAVIEFLAGTNAHLICLQETDRNARRTEGHNIAAEISRALKMNYAFGIEFEELSEGSTESPAYHGQATLSVFPFTDSRILRFRDQSCFWRPRWWVPNQATFQRRVGGRIALYSNVRIGDRTLGVYNLHLESRSDRVRRAQLSELLEDARGYDGDGPIIVAGDFNFDLAEPSAASVIADARFHNPFKDRLRTTPSNHFGRKGVIDWILLKGPLGTVDARVHSSVSASDHYPISLTLRQS